MLSRKALAASAAALITGATLLSAGSADARPRYYYGHGYHHGGGWGRGGAAAAGVVGGLALGALAAGAYNSGPYYSSPGYAYGPAPAYGAYGAYGGCYITRETVYDSWGQPHWRRVRVCD